LTAIPALLINQSIVSFSYLNLLISSTMDYFLEISTFTIVVLYLISEINFDYYYKVFFPSYRSLIAIMK